MFFFWSDLLHFTTFSFRFDNESVQYRKLYYKRFLLNFFTSKQKVGKFTSAFSQHFLLFRFRPFIKFWFRSYFLQHCRFQILGTFSQERMLLLSCWKRGRQVRRETGKEPIRKGGTWELRDKGNEGCSRGENAGNEAPKKGGMLERRETERKWDRNIFQTSIILQRGWV